MQEGAVFYFHLYITLTKFKKLHCWGWGSIPYCFEDSASNGILQIVKKGKKYCLSVKQKCRNLHTIFGLD